MRSPSALALLALTVATPLGCAALLGIDDWSAPSGAGAGTSSGTGGSAGASTSTGAGGAGAASAGGGGAAGGPGGSGTAGAGGTGGGDVCGDGVVTGAEECDDGTPAGNDGCDVCQVTCSKTLGDGAQTALHLDPIGKHCYRVESPGAGDWDARRTDCALWGGDLVTITSLEENVLVGDLLDTLGNGLVAWIGLNDLANDGQPVWAETNMPPTGFTALQPSNDAQSNCALFHQDDGTWHMSTCDSLAMAICERHPGLP